MNILSGDFFTAENGGVIIIKDTRGFSEFITRTSKQPMVDKVVESFKNYHYDIGVMKSSLRNSDLILDMAFNGETGKRNITVAVHDFTNGGGL
ncbi:MAG: hypothetical protein HY591_02065 [Candidatus Omnitrophica bacterium]|nr:hypothetical protein [Candidatus Omnitrophota bacterium]